MPCILIVVLVNRILNSKCVMNTIKTRNETITNDLPQKNDQFADQNDFYHFSLLFIIIKNLKGFCAAVYFILSF